MDSLTYDLVLAGLAVGSAAALTGIGLIVTYRATGVLNLAHGAIAMICAFLLRQLAVGWGWPLPLAACVTLLIAAPGLGLLMSLLATDPTRALVASIGAFVLLIGVAGLVWGTGARPDAPALLPDDPWIQLATVCVLAGAVTAVTHRTRFGRHLRAVVDNRALAELGGIDAGRVAAAGWAFGAFTAGLTGVLLAPYVRLDPYGLPLLVMEVMAVAVAARMRSMPVAVGTALALGVTQSQLTRFHPPGSLDPLLQAVGSNLFVVALLIAALAVRGVGDSVPPTTDRGKGVVRRLRRSEPPIAAPTVRGAGTSAPTSAWGRSVFRRRTPPRPRPHLRARGRARPQDTERAQSAPGIAAPDPTPWQTGTTSRTDRRRNPRAASGARALRRVREALRTLAPHRTRTAAPGRRTHAALSTHAAAAPRPLTASRTRSATSGAAPRLRTLAWVPVFALLLLPLIKSPHAALPVPALAVVLLSLVVVAGRSGQLALGQAAYAGLGALFAARLSGHLPVLVALLLAVALVAPLGLLTGWPAIRRRGLALALTTLAVGTAVSRFVLDQPYATSGVTVARPAGFGSDRAFYLLELLALVAALLSVAALRRGRTGRALAAMRDHEQGAAASGVPVPRLKLLAFTLGAALAALGGALLSLGANAFDPTAYEPVRSLLWFAALMILGADTLLAAPVAAALLTVLDSGSRTGLAATAVGALALLLTRFRPALRPPRPRTPTPLGERARARLRLPAPGSPPAARRAPAPSMPDLDPRAPSSPTNSASPTARSPPSTASTSPSSPAASPP